MSRVFVVQDQHRWDPAQSKLIPKFDLTPALEYGTFVHLLGSNASPFKPENIIPELREKLADITNDDHILLIGNPVLIGWTVAIAADMNDGDVNLLQWSGKDRRYISIRAQVYDWSDEQ